MNWFFIAAAALIFLTGLTHTVFGERLIFRRMRQSGCIPTNGGTVLREPNVRILWATWHLATVQAWLIALLLAWLALPEQAQFSARGLIAIAIAAAMLAGAALVFFGTKARHPGWIALLGASILTGLGLLP